MRPAFDTLLDATLDYLATLKESGACFVQITPETLSVLRKLERPLPLTPASPSRESPPPAIEAPGDLSPSVRSTRQPSISGGPGSTGPAEQRNTRETVLAGEETGRVPISSASAAAVDKSEMLAAIRERALVCQKCPHLVRSRTQVVFGIGNVDAEVMFVGEAPGAEEDRQGEPFVGRAGQLLTRIIQAMGYQRETVYIANILKCRPDVPPGSRGNRPPREDEMETCKPYLRSQIEIIQPGVIVALGATAMQGLLGIKSPIGSVRGQWKEFRGIPVMPTFHPSYLLRAEDGEDRGRTEKRKTWEDMLLVLERLSRAITPKMRGYFLK